MDKPTVYAGDGSFVFVSYSHKDEALAMAEIRQLQSEGVDVWYDDGIRAGSEWSDAIAAAIKECQSLVFLVTPNSVESENCRREINFAMAESKVITPVHLLPTLVPDGLRLSLENRQSLHKYELSGEEYWQRLLSALSIKVASAAEPEVDGKTSKPVTVGLLGAVIAVMLAVWAGIYWTTPKAVPLGRSIYVEDTRLASQQPGGVDDLVALVTRYLSDYQELVVSRNESPQHNYVLSSVVNADDGQIRITVRLERQADQKVVWSEIVDTNAKEISKVANQIARQVRFNVMVDESCLRVRMATDSEDAARYLCEALADNFRINQGGRFDVEQWKRKLDRVIQADPSLIDSYWLLSVYYRVNAGNRISRADSDQLAHQQVEAGLAIDPTYPLMFWVKGLLQMNSYLDYAGARESFEKAIDLDPMSPQARWFHASLGESYVYQGNLSEAVTHYQRAIDLHDGDARLLSEYARVLILIGAYKEALQMIENGSALVRAGNIAYQLGLLETTAHQLLGNEQQAVAAAERTIEKISRAWRSALPPLLAATGAVEDARRITDTFSDGDRVDPEHKVRAYLAIGDLERAFKWVHVAIDERDKEIVRIIRSGHVLEPLRQDPRWDAVLSHLHREEAAPKPEFSR